MSERFSGPEIERKARRRLRSAQSKPDNFWFGLGTMGMVGWSISLPTLIGIAAGSWLDAHYPRPYSWTLMLLGVGLFLGCLNAWAWVSREQRRSFPEEPPDDE